MEFSIKSFVNLSLNELYDIIALRVKVFVVEQNCPYQELDGWDRYAEHMVVMEGAELAATLRILPPGTTYDVHSIGRVVVDPAFRGTGLGHQIMERAIDYLKKRKGMSRLPIKLSAQEHLKAYYEKHGFEQSGEGYLEDGIPHIPMLKILSE